MSRRGPIRLALVGGPLLEGDFDLFDAIEACGGRIVLDATEGGELTLPAAWDAGRLRDDPLGELCRAYFGSIPHPARRPDTLLAEWLDRELAARDVAGIIFHRFIWCDTWHGQLARLRQTNRRPVLDLDSAGEAGLSARRLTRIAAFMETLA